MPCWYTRAEEGEAESGVGELGNDFFFRTKEDHDGTIAQRLSSSAGTCTAK